MVEKDKTKLIDIEHQCHHHRVKPSHIHTTTPVQDIGDSDDIIPGVMTTSPKLINRGTVPDIAHVEDESQSPQRQQQRQQRQHGEKQSMSSVDQSSGQFSTAASLPLSMEAWVISELNREEPWESLVMVQQYPTPTIQYHVKSDEVLVKMYAASVNELFDYGGSGMSSGVGVSAALSPLPQDVPQLFTTLHLSSHRTIAGRDGAGQVVYMGPEASGYWKGRIQVGDHVLGIIDNSFSSMSHESGTLAQYAIFQCRNIARRPMALSWQQCASLPVASLSIWNCWRHVPQGVKNPVQRTRPLRVLVHGADTGPGSLAVLLSKYYFHADRVYATCSESRHMPYVRRLLSESDNDRVIDMETQVFEQIIREDAEAETEQQHQQQQQQQQDTRKEIKGYVNVVIDTLGGYDLWKKSCELLDHDSYFCSIVRPRELLEEDASIMDLLKFGGTLVMEKLKHWTMDHPNFYCLSTMDNSDGALEHLADFFANKMDQVHITEFSMLEAKRAHELFYGHDLPGKIVINISQEQQ